MRYHVQMAGSTPNNADQSNRYALEVHADHQQEARAIALAKAQAAGVEIDLTSIEISAYR